jgi:hypothetical protein
MAIIIHEYGSSGSVHNTITPDNTPWSQVLITKLTATEVIGAITIPGQGSFVIDLTGNFNLSAFNTAPTSLTDIAGNLTFQNTSTASTRSVYKDGVLKDAYVFSPAVSQRDAFNMDHTLASNNVIYAGHDIFYSSTGAAGLNNDTISGYSGYLTYYDYHSLIKNSADLIYGGTGGINTVVLQGPQAHYKFSYSTSLWNDPTGKNDAVGYLISDTTGQTNNVQISNVQRIEFGDSTGLALDIAPNQTAGSVYMLYQATFNRTPDAAGLGYWMAQVDQGANIITTVAASFVQSPEFVAKYGSNPSNVSYVDNLYQNVLHRSGDSGGIVYWNGQLNTGAASKAFVLEQFATLAEGAALVAPAIAHGIAYAQWVG